MKHVLSRSLSLLALLFMLLPGEGYAEFPPPPVVGGVSFSARVSVTTTRIMPPVGVGMHAGIVGGGFGYMPPPFGFGFGGPRVIVIVRRGGRRCRRCRRRRFVMGALRAMGGFGGFGGFGGPGGIF